MCIKYNIIYRDTELYRPILLCTNEIRSKISFYLNL